MGGKKWESGLGSIGGGSSIPVATHRKNGYQFITANQMPVRGSLLLIELEIGVRQLQMLNKHFLF